MKFYILLFRMALLLMLFNPFYIQLWGQPTGNMANLPAEGILSGTIKDQSTGQAIEYASIALYRQKDSSLVTGTISGPNGIFRIEKIPYGMYRVHIKFLGYNTLDINRVMISPKSPEVNMGEIKLEAASKVLDAVEVTAKREMLTYNLDKKVFTIDQNIAAQGGTLAEAMQNIPSVNIDIDGNVSLRGSENVTVLIDGKPSQMGGVDEIPASIVESIEIVTNPSAKYDPDGMSGIINVILKKKRQPGYNAMLQLNAGTGDKYNGSFNINYRINRLNVYINSSFRQFAAIGKSVSERESVIRDTASLLNQDGKFRRKGQFGNITAGIEYNFNDRTRITGSVSGGLRNFSTNEDTRYTNLNYLTEKTLETFRESDTRMESWNIEYNLGFKHIIEEKKHEFSADFFYSTNDGNNINQIATDMLFPVTLSDYLIQKTQNDMKGNVITLQADYFRPAGNGGRLETGLKATWRTTDYDYRFHNYDTALIQWVIDPAYTNHFIYNSPVYAAYMMYSNTIEKFSYQAGLRFEQALTKGNQKTTGEKFEKPYSSLFPTLSLKYDLNEKNSLQLNYSRRVNRPQFMQVNPFQNISDPYNISMGNPKLNPEYANTAELGHQAQLGKTSLTTTLFVRQTDRMITRITTMDSTGINYTTFKNINKSRTSGIEFVVMQPVAKWWRLTGNFSWFKAEVIGEGISAKSSQSNSWTAKLVSNMNLPYGFDLQIIGNYRSPTVTTGSGGPGRMFEMGSQGKTREMYTVDLGMKKDVIKNKLSMTLRVSDVFKTSKFMTTTYGPNFTTNTTRTRDSRVLFIGLSYRINDYKRTREPKRSDENQSEEFE